METTCSLKDDIKRNLGCALGLTGLGQNPVVGSFKQGNNVPLGTIKLENFLISRMTISFLKRPFFMEFIIVKATVGPC